MRYTYVYKTPDGVRHEAAMEAASRDEAFVALRRDGIRPIKVIAADGSKANGEIRGVRKRIVAVIAVTAAGLAGILSYLILRQAPVQTVVETEPTIVFTSDAARCAYTNIEAQAIAIVAKHTAAIKALDLDQLTDYALIERTENIGSLTERIRSGYKAVDTSRTATRELFKTIFVLFPSDCESERTAAQKLYAKTMDVLSASEGRIANDEKALKLLDTHRSKWHTVVDPRGTAVRVKWTDAALANEFEYFRRNTLTAR